MKRLFLLIAATAALTMLALSGTAAAKSRDRNHDGITGKEEVENENEQGDDSQARAAHDGGDDSDRSGSDNSGPGSTSSGPEDGQNENEQQENCTTADLTQGTVVHEAELHMENGATFEKVE